MNDVKTTIQIYGIKLLQLKIFDVSYLFLDLVENLWYLQCCCDRQLFYISHFTSLVP